MQLSSDFQSIKNLNDMINYDYDIQNDKVNVFLGINKNVLLEFIDAKNELTFAERIANNFNERLGNAEWIQISPLSKAGVYVNVDSLSQVLCIEKTKVSREWNAKMVIVRKLKKQQKLFELGKTVRQIFDIKMKNLLEGVIPHEKIQLLPRELEPPEKIQLLKVTIIQNPKMGGFACVLQSKIMKNNFLAFIDFYQSFLNGLYGKHAPGADDVLMVDSALCYLWKKNNHQIEEIKTTIDKERDVYKEKIEHKMKSIKSEQQMDRLFLRQSAVYSRLISLSVCFEESEILL